MYSTNMRMDSHALMDIDSWTSDRPQSDLAMSYSSVGQGQPPSIGNVRPIVVSEPSGGSQMYSDGQPPSVNDVVDESHLKPGISEFPVENHLINPELWLACAGPLVNLPAAGTQVIYFPQGQFEQVDASMQKGVHIQIPNYPNLQSKLFCILQNVTLHADTETDEIYAHMTLQPTTSLDKEVLLRSELLTEAHKPEIKYFCKTLTSTDMITGVLSVPHSAAEKIFQPLDLSMQEPAREIVVRDLHDNVWKFLHVYGGQQMGHLLMAGLSTLVSRKRLVPGDSVLFIRDNKQQVLLGIRRANRQPSTLSKSALMHFGSLAAAAHAAANNSPFPVFYDPMACPSEFVIPLAKYYKAVCSNQISLGIRFQMMFETGELETRKYMGTIIGISDIDDVRWKNSHWRNLEVGWDDDTAGQRGNRVSLWEIEPVTDPFLISQSQPINQSNHPRQGILDNEYMDLDKSYKIAMPWLDEDKSVKVPGLSLVEWMNMEKSNQIQSSYFTPWKGSDGRPDLSLQLGLPASQTNTQKNVQLNNQQFLKPQQQLIDLTQLKTARQNLINQTQVQLQFQAQNVFKHQSAIQNLELQQQQQPNQIVRSQEGVQPLSGDKLSSVMLRKKGSLESLSSLQHQGGREVVFVGTYNAVLDPVAAIKMHYAKAEQYKNGRETESWQRNHLNHPFETDMKIIVNNVNGFP